MDGQRAIRKRTLVAEHVAGLSFVDIGGLWGTNGEMVTTAAAAGASRTAMADVQPLGGVWWKRFEERCAERGVSGYDEVRVDICASDAPETLGRFDFVHCSGVMYHVPDLVGFVGNLISVADRYLLLSSVVMPEELHTSSGSLVFGPDNAYLAPLLDGRNREVVLDHLRENDLKAAGLTDDQPFFTGGRPRFGPWWWLFSGTFMSRLLRMHGLEVLAEGPSPNGHAHTVFARVPQV
ncbi:MAG TPA: hypothetical protein VFM09_14885 [Marmoricola sp.]|nr:hypothetical protein [Marmoricola sp.]